MIHNIEISNFGCFEKLSLKPKKINLIIGRNGTGKSTFLDAVYYALGASSIQPFKDALISERIRYGAKNSKVEVNLGDRAAQFELSSGLDSVMSPNDKQQINDWVSKLSKKYKDDAEKLPKSFGKFDSSILNNVLNDVCVYKQIEKNGTETLNRFILQLPITPSEKNYGFFFLSKISPIRYTEWSSAYLVNEKGSVPLSFHRGTSKMSDEERVLQLVQNYLMDKGIIPYLIRLGSRTYVTETDGVSSEHPLSSLGQGTQALLQILQTSLVIQHGVSLIDELETHLHPGFVDSLVKTIAQTYEDNDLQYFITTHSIDVIQAFLDIGSLRDDFQIIQLLKDGRATVMEFEEALNCMESIGIDLRGV